MKILNLVLIVPLFIIFRFKGYAQDNDARVTGIIKDSLTQQPLPNASIVFTNTTTSALLNTVSTSKGNFTINAIKPGKYELLVQYIGYHTFIKTDITIAENQHEIEIGDIYLGLQARSLDDVVITSRKPKPFIVFENGKIVLNVAQSPIATGGTAYEVLLRAPGVTAQNNALTFRTKSVSVLIDDKPTRLSDEELRDMLSAMPANSIDKVEIVPNPSAKYDAQAGSIINIKLVKSKEYGLNGSLTSGIGAGRFMKYNEGLNLNFKNQHLNLYGAYDFQHTQQYYDNRFNRKIDETSNISQKEYEIRTRNNNGLRLGADYEINKSNLISVGLKGYANHRSKEAYTNSALLHQMETDSSSEVNMSGTSKVYNPSVNLYYKTVLDSLGKNLTVNADYFNYDKRWNDNFSTRYFDKLGNLYQPDYLLRDNSPADIRTYSFAADYVHPSKIGKFELGIKSQYTVSDNNILWEELKDDEWVTDVTKTNYFIYKEHINAAYLNFSRTVKRFNFVLGIRAEQTDTKGSLINQNTVNKRQYFNIFPNINFEYAADLEHILAITYRKSIQRFGFNIVNPFLIYQSQYAYYQGNPDIRPEIDHNLEISYTWHQAVVFGMSYTRGQNALAPVYLRGDNNQVISTFDNLKSSDLFYVYVDFTYQLASWWNTYISGGTGFIKYEVDSSSLSGQNGKASWSYLFQTQNTFKFNNSWTAEINSSYRGPYNSGVYRTNRNFTTSIGISKGLLANRANIKLAVQDVFNTDKQELNVNYQGVLMDVTNKAESRFLNIALTWKFGNRNMKARKQPASSTIDDIKQRINTNQ